jgi:hypothetical protein
MAPRLNRMMLFSTVRALMNVGNTKSTAILDMKRERPSVTYWSTIKSPQLRWLKR